MFNCRICSGTPFTLLFGEPKEASKKAPEKQKNKNRRKISEQRSESSVSKTNLSSEITSSHNTSISTFTKSNKSLSPTKLSYEPRKHEEIREICEEWLNAVHPRAKEFWTNENDMRKMLWSIARYCSKSDDPIFGDESTCVIWHGNYSSSYSTSSMTPSSLLECEKGGIPVVYTLPPNSERLSIIKNKSTTSQKKQKYLTHVNRLLVFMYSDESSFSELQTKDKKELCMACGERRCINLLHVSLD